MYSSHQAIIWCDASDHRDAFKPSHVINPSWCWEWIHQVINTRTTTWHAKKDELVSCNTLLSTEERVKRLSAERQVVFFCVIVGSLDKLSRFRWANALCHVVERRGFPEMNKVVVEASPGARRRWCEKEKVAVPVGSHLKMQLFCYTHTP